jgi:hypothetical protein
LSGLLKGKDFRQEVRAVAAAEHLASEAVVDGMALEQRDGKAS